VRGLEAERREPALLGLVEAAVLPAVLVLEVTRLHG